MSRLCFSFFLTLCGFGRAVSLWGLAWKGFLGEPADKSITASRWLSITNAHTHIFPGSTSHFTAYWVTWCDTSAIYWQIWDSWGKECFLTFPPSPHAPLAPNRGKMKTNTVGFVVRQKPAALNLHDSSHTLPLVPVEAGQRRGKNAFFQIYFCLFT